MERKRRQDNKNKDKESNGKGEKREREIVKNGVRANVRVIKKEKGKSIVRKRIWEWGNVRRGME